MRDRNSLMKLTVVRVRSFPVIPPKSHTRMSNGAEMPLKLSSRAVTQRQLSKLSSSTNDACAPNFTLTSPVPLLKFSLRLVTFLGIFRCVSNKIAVPAGVTASTISFEVSCSWEPNSTTQSPALTCCTTARFSSTELAHVIHGTVAESPFVVGVD